MANVFKAVLDISLAASALALLALLARLVIGRRPNAVLPLLSLLVILRLAIPAAIPSPLSVMNLFQDISIQQPAAVAANLNEAVDNGLAQPETNPVNTAVNTATENGMQPEAADPVINAAGNNTADIPAQKALSFMDIASLIWIAGVAAMAACIAASNIRFALTLKKNRRYEAPGFGGLLEQCKQELGIRRRIEAVQLSGINTAAVYGVFRPKLLVSPSFGWLSEQEKRHVLLHELSHIKRRDTLVCLLITALSAVYWFNPVIWIALVLARRDMEVMCDMAVLKLTQDKRSYASTLFSLAKASGNLKPKLVSALFIGPQNALRFGVLISTDSIKRRMKMITRYKKSRLFTAVSIILVIAITVTGCTGAVSGNSSKEPIISEVHSPEITTPETEGKVLVSSYSLDYSAIANDKARASNIEKAVASMNDTKTEESRTSGDTPECYIGYMMGPIREAGGWQIASWISWDKVDNLDNWISAKGTGSSGYIENIGNLDVDIINAESSMHAGGGIDIVLIAVLKAATLAGGRVLEYPMLPDEYNRCSIGFTGYSSITFKVRAENNIITAEFYAPAETAAEPTTTPMIDPNEASPTIDPNDWRQKFPGKFSDSAQQTENSYKDANIDITIERVEKDGATYFIADIYIAELKYFRTAFAADADKMGKREPTDTIAKEVNAILAINGDHCTDNPGTVVRNGQLYREKKSSADVLVMNYDGSMQTYSPDEFDVEKVKKEGAYQVWTFGPMLLKEGQPVTEFNSSLERANPRTAVGYYEPGHYCFVVADGRQQGYSDGLTLKQLSQVFASLGCKAAYNMDGGQSSEMVLAGNMVNHPYNGGRSTPDILYIGE